VSASARDEPANCCFEKLEYGRHDSSFSIDAVQSIDTIVIGSGPGGMTAAVALARSGLSVLVLEQHYLPGGWTHSFTLEGYRFSPGIHYLGDLEQGQGLRRLFEGLGLGERLAFHELNPDAIDHVIVGSTCFDVPKGKERYVQRLKARFPCQAEGIDRYFTVIEDLAREVGSAQRLTLPRLLSLPLRAPTLLRWGFRTLESLLDATISDPTLRAILSARCGNHGMAPSQVSLPLHAAMDHHYFKGAYYPQGGAKAISSAYVKTLRRHGGQIRLRTRVARILVESDRAVGVELESGEQIRARHVVSNADATLTYLSLLPRGAAPKEQRRAEKAEMSVSSLSLFAAVDMDLGAMGYDSGNYWWYRHADLNGIYRRMQESAPDADVDGLFLSVSTLKDPHLRRDGHHTLEMFTFVPHDSFARWKDEPCGQRSAEYQRLKRTMIDRMLAAAEHIIPDLRRRVVFLELGTPLTNDHYCATRRGAVYGTAKSRRQVGPFSFSTKSPIENLFLCGASTISHGVGGAASSGLSVAGAILGVDGRELLGPEDGSIVIEPAGPVLRAQDARVGRRVGRPMVVVERG
jgi:phytoene dehydrogenase-like protein